MSNTDEQLGIPPAIDTGGSDNLPPARHRTRRPPLQPSVETTHNSNSAPATASGGAVQLDPSPGGVAAAAASEPLPKTNPDGSKVGYKNPPHNTRWKQGQSGNPKGRTKGSKNVKTIYFERLNDRVKAKGIDGRTKSETVLEAIIRGQIFDALTEREHKTVVHVLAEVGRMGLFDDAPAGGEPAVRKIEGTDQEIADRILERLAAAKKLSGGEK